MSVIASAKVRFIIANSKIKGIRSAGLGLSDEKNISEKHRDEWLGALAQAGEEAIRQEGFADWNHYWLVALSQEMTVPDFVFLLETHLLDPAQLAAEIKRTAVPLRTLVMQSLREAFENNESWLFQARNGGRTLQDHRLRPREAAEWFLRRPLDQNKLPDTLRAFLESSERHHASAQSIQPPKTGAPGRPSSMHVVQDEARRRRESGQAEEAVTSEAKYLKQWFDDHSPVGMPPLTARTIQNKIRAEHNEWRNANPRN
jgi:hypothetical protein